jgi:hypothetical protein
VAGGVEHGEDDDGIIPHNEENPIRKPLCQNASHLRMKAQPQMNEWIFNGALDGQANLTHKFQP